MADERGARLPILAGTIAIVLGNLVTACFAGGSIIGVAAGMGLYGLGLSFIQSPAISAVTQVIPKSMIGTGMGIYMMIFFIGGAFGVAMSVTAVELQSVTSASWLGFSHLGEGARYSNAILVLTALAVVNVFLNPLIPPKGAQPR